jgi:G6PDH family F420-dependent oxidoreductase
MVEFGYALSSEEHEPNSLVRFAARAEESGFGFALISDHFHPWIDRQGQSPFVWAVIGGISQVTSKLRLGTGVTCPTVRLHPALVAQAAATAACMMPGRFFLGVGTGENLNEHILGDHWPPSGVRQEMLVDAIDVIRELWTGEEVTHYGPFYTVEEARLYTRPETPPPLLVAAGGPAAAELAAANDGLISTAPKRELIEAFEEAGGEGKPKYGQLAVCWAETEQQAKRTALEWWPSTLVPSSVSWELKTPKLFEALVADATEDDVAKQIVCGPDPDKHASAIRKFIEAGYDHVYVHQVGPDQEGFFRFYERDVLPALRREREPAGRMR